MKKFIVSLLLTQTALSTAFAGVADVVPPKFKIGSTYVRVTQLPKNKIRFEKCIKGYEEGTCRTLGRKDSYEARDLIIRRDRENVEAAGSISAIVLTVGAGAGIGAANGASASGLAGNTGFIAETVHTLHVATGVFIGTGTTLTLAAGAKQLSDAFNPGVQIDQAKTLNTEVIRDKLVVYEDMDYFIDNLETVLEKIK